MLLRFKSYLIMIQVRLSWLINFFNDGGVAQLVERQASNRKVAKSRFNSRCGSESVYPWEKHLLLFPILGQAVFLLWWPSLTKDMQTEQLLCLARYEDTKRITSGSNVELFNCTRVRNELIYHGNKLGWCVLCTYRNFTSGTPCIMSLFLQVFHLTHLN